MQEDRIDAMLATQDPNPFQKLQVVYEDMPAAGDVQVSCHWDAVNASKCVVNVKYLCGHISLSQDNPLPSKRWRCVMERLASATGRPLTKTLLSQPVRICAAVCLTRCARYTGGSCFNLE